MASRSIELRVNEQLARRLLARAADLGQNIDEVILQDLAAWLGDWGLATRSHIVSPGETLALIAKRYYGDPEKYTVIAAYNDIEDPALVHVGRELIIPEAGPPEPLPIGESPYIFGLHDRGGEHYMGWSGRKGWVLCTEAVGCGTDDWSSRSYDDLAGGGYGVIARLNNGYHPGGTLPRSDHYAAFARRCGNFVERSRGCHIWVIGNEPNLPVERPGGPENGEPITPQRYADAYRLVRQEIRNRPGHGEDQVIVAAVGPWNSQTTYPANPSGDWVIYFQHVLQALEGVVDGMAIHTYARDPDPANIVSEARMDPPFDHRRKMFRTYIDLMNAVPRAMRHLPVYLTETNQNAAWLDVNNGWVQEAYAEIHRWNSDVTHQKIRCMLLYRWIKAPNDIWSIEDKDGVIGDFRAALQHEYRWYG
jgi:hypothetical protein